MPKNAEIVVSGIGKMRLGQAESEISKMRDEMKSRKEAGEETHVKALQESIKPYQDAVSKFYRVTSHRRSWL